MGVQGFEVQLSYWTDPDPSVPSDAYRAFCHRISAHNSISGADYTSRVILHPR